MADEQDRLRRLRQLQADQAAAEKAAAEAKAKQDAYYTRNPKTGLSPAQEEANAAVAEAAAAAKAAGTPAVVLKTPGSANKVSTPPYAAPTGTQWQWVGSTNTDSVAAGSWKLVKLSGTTSTTDSSGNTDNSGGGTIFRFINGILYANGSPFTGSYQGKSYQDGKELNFQNNKTYTAPDGKIFTNLDEYNAYVAQANQEAKTRAGQSAYSLLFSQFQQYGLGALVEPLKNLITEGLSAAEFTLRLRDTDAYKKRFAANQQRINKGLRALSEAEYIALEDQYQNVMRNYGLPESYYQRGDMGAQPGFEKFIAGDVSAAELEDRIATAQNRVINAAPEVSRALREFYPDITNSDILAYVLDPQQALTNIKRKVTAAEIGGATMAEGLATGLARAEELQRFGVTGAGYRQAAPFIKQAAERGSQLTSFYNQGQFDQTTAEQAALGISGSAEAQKKIRKLTELEQASFSGQVGRAGGALARERAGQF